MNKKQNTILVKLSHTLKSIHNGTARVFNVQRSCGLIFTPISGNALNPYCKCCFGITRYYSVTTPQISIFYSPLVLYV